MFFFIFLSLSLLLAIFRYKHLNSYIKRFGIIKVKTWISNSQTSRSNSRNWNKFKTKNKWGTDEIKWTHSKNWWAIKEYKLTIITNIRTRIKVKRYYRTKRKRCFEIKRRIEIARRRVT